MKQGYTLIELIVYVAIFAVFSVLATNSLLTMTRVFAENRVMRDLNSGAVVSMERISREIKGANSIDVALSTFSSNPGVLTLNSTDASGVARTVKFYVSDGILKIDENGTYLGDLTSQYVTVSNIIFRTFSTPQSSVIKIEMTLTSTRGNLVRTENFYNTISLRGDY